MNGVNNMKDIITKIQEIDLEWIRLTAMLEEPERYKSAEIKEQKELLVKLLKQL